MPIYHDSSNRDGFEHLNIYYCKSLCYIPTITCPWAKPFLDKSEGWTSIDRQFKRAHVGASLAYDELPITERSNTNAKEYKEFGAWWLPKVLWSLACGYSFSGEMKCSALKEGSDSWTSFDGSWVLWMVSDWSESCTLAWKAFLNFWLRFHDWRLGCWFWLSFFLSLGAGGNSCWREGVDVEGDCYLTVCFLGWLEVSLCVLRWSSLGLWAVKKG